MFQGPTSDTLKCCSQRFDTPKNKECDDCRRVKSRDSYDSCKKNSDGLTDSCCQCIERAKARDIRNRRAAEGGLGVTQ